MKLARLTVTRKISKLCLNVPLKVIKNTPFNFQVYSGFAQRNLFNGLEARTMYRYRIKYKCSGKESPWSRPVEVMTIKKPPSADDLHKAVSRDDIDSVSKLLEGKFLDYSDK